LKNQQKYAIFFFGGRLAASEKILHNLIDYGS